MKYCFEAREGMTGPLRGLEGKANIPGIPVQSSACVLLAAGASLWWGSQKVRSVHGQVQECPDVVFADWIEMANRDPVYSPARDLSPR